VLQTVDGDRQASTIFSRGCPFACDFARPKNRWLGLDRENAADIEFWSATVPTGSCSTTAISSDGVSSNFATHS
jgi:hypothetical protein